MMNVTLSAPQYRGEILCSTVPILTHFGLSSGTTPSTKIPSMMCLHAPGMLNSSISLARFTSTLTRTGTFRTGESASSHARLPRLRASRTSA